VFWERNDDGHPFTRKMVMSKNIKKQMMTETGIKNSSLTNSPLLKADFWDWKEHGFPPFFFW